MTSRRFTAEPATTHPADIHAAQVAQGLIEHLPAHIAEESQRAGDQAMAETGDLAEAERAAESVVREWLFSGGLQDLGSDGRDRSSDTPICAVCGHAVEDHHYAHMWRGFLCDVEGCDCASFDPEQDDD